MIDLFGTYDVARLAGAGLVVAIVTGLAAVAIRAARTQDRLLRRSGRVRGRGTP